MRNVFLSILLACIPCPLLAESHYNLSGSLDGLHSRAPITLAPRPVPIRSGNFSIDLAKPAVSGRFTLETYRVHVSSAGVTAHTPAAEYQLDTHDASVVYDDKLRILTVKGARLRYHGGESQCDGFFCRYQPASPDLQTFDLTLVFNEDHTQFTTMKAQGISEGSVANTHYTFSFSGKQR